MQNVLSSYGYTAKYTGSWQDAANWPGEVIILFEYPGQPTPLAWPPSFNSGGHLILWMKDLGSTLFNDPLAFDQNTKIKADCNYNLASVQSIFNGALLLP
jgi:hypothetical protein